MGASSLSTGLIPCLAVLFILVTTTRADYLNMDTGKISNTTDPYKHSLPGWLQPLVPDKGPSISDEVRCYNLPIGLIGFISHLLNYWAMFWLGFGRKPYAPWMYLSAGKIDLFLSWSQILTSSAIASFTISRCRNREEFIMISAWKLVMSLEIGIWGVSASLKARENSRRHGKYYQVGFRAQFKQIWSSEDWTPYTIIFYVAGMIVGMYGTIEIVNQVWTDRRIVIVTAVFTAVTAAIILVCMGSWCCCNRSENFNAKKLTMAITFTLILVSALYSDWILAVIADNMVGVPSGDNMYLYWAYFAAKRLPLLFS